MDRKQIENTDDYYVKRDGTVVGARGLPLTPVLTSSGYHQVTTKEGGEWKSRVVHRLVAEAFIPNPENKPEVNHINGIKTDNRVENLEWVTSKENQIHANSVLGRQVGEKHPRSKLTDEQVHEICRRLEEGERNYTIARDFGVDETTIVNIRKGKNWTHISKQYNMPYTSRNLSVEDVEWICEMLQEGLSYKEILSLRENPKITLSVLKGIKGRSNYKNISAPYNF